MNSVLVVACKVLLVFFALGILVVQLFILPRLANESLELFPEVGFLYAPLLYLLEFVTVLADVVIVCLWMLLSRITRGIIFASDSLRLVNVIVGCFLATAAVFIVIFCIFQFGINAGGPSVFLGSLGGAGASIFAALVLLVMRGLLRTAIQQQDYLAEVV